MNRRRNRLSTSAPAAPAAPETDETDEKESPVETVNPDDVTIMSEDEAKAVVDNSSALVRLTTAPIETGTPKRGGAWAAVKDSDGRIRATVTLTNRSLEELETVVATGLLAFVEAGRALLEIRMRELWKKTGYKSFGTYAVARFGLSRPRLYQLIEIAQVAAILVDNGVAVPRLANRLNDLAVMKSNPDVLAATAQALNDASPSGDLSDLPRSQVQDEAGAAANQADGGERMTDRQEREAEAQAETPADDLDVDDEEEEEDDADVVPDPDPEETPAPASTRTRSASPAPLRDSEKVADATLTTVESLLKRGQYVDVSGANYGVICRIAGLALSYVARDWAGQPGKAKEYIVNADIAKAILKGKQTTALTVVPAADAKKVEQEQAKAALSPEQRAQVERNEAAVRLSREAQVSKDAGYVKPDPKSFSKNPKDAAESYAILDAQRDWHQAGEPGQSPVSGQQVRRATKWLDDNTAPEGEAKEETPVAPLSAAEMEQTPTEEEEMSDEETEALLAELSDDDEEEESEETEESEEEMDLDVVA